jgi:hypothetical protein
VSVNELDHLSDPARKLLKMDVGGAYIKLVVHGDGNVAARRQLEELTPENVLSTAPRNADAAAAMLAGLWLWHDWLDQSHQISQTLHTSSGSMWHAIMHRREGDFSNSKYWIARCENHPILPMLAAQASDLISAQPADKSLLKLTHYGWNADAFVDLVESVHDRPTDPRHQLAVALQQLEWRLLFDHCTREATGK